MLKGETTRNQPDTGGIKFQTAEAPQIEKDNCNDVEIYADTMHVIHVTFLTSISYDVHCGTI